MNQIVTNLLTNKHTSIAGLVYLVGKFGTQIAGVWFPSHKAQLDATAGYIEGAAVAYGLFAAGDAGKSSGLQEVKDKVNALNEAVVTGNTEILKSKP